MVSDFEAQVRATNDKINARSGRPLVRAIIVGLVLGGSLLVSLIVVKELYMLFAAALIGFTSFELASALRFAGRDVPRLPTVVAGLAVVPAAFYWGATGHWLVTLAGIAAIAVWRLVELVRPSHRVSGLDLLKDIGAGAFIMAYVAFMGGYTVLLTAQDGGQWWTLAFLIVVVAVDTGAYASGLAFGRHKMAPIISPGKTWEGFAGSVVVAIVAGVLLALFMLQQPWWVGIVLGVVLVGTATIGDLAESLIKRDLGIKDISTWLPGHGGFLDRVDSSLLSGAAAFALFLIFT
ncbi:phosphatidate cytidylyltransferase [Salinibacterium soli]|uniref:Phosphatidate cytidylyltransferase n=1 Tax=Antiquaquibacter soli TaxID=3064523 RepID=A0ABT9BN67_9MICO|nr:phosphatidate cytidylyltransferase [Protaetiibacter sp. WY-16]MDO7882478.1 phosphatidate cytidylyltransferase [Protaetiibacter sp. WY-16]